MDYTQQTLTSAYRDFLADLPLHWLDRSRAHDEEFAKLSGLFLPGISAAYQQASRRIMVVGRETRRWNVVTDQAPFLCLCEDIPRAMAIQQSHLTKELLAPPDKGTSFINLLRARDHDRRGCGQHTPRGTAGRYRAGHQRRGFVR